ncbi:helix-turn-helix domain-containing protein [Moheibacter stercoris]|uniref:AraC-like DNA-binding protein n=1 Tax=Moheibacter stercoris TaxID=1628251 RepID=A0ABV2LTA3_9FLAO
MKKIQLGFITYFIFIGFFANAQINESEKLLVQAEEVLLYNPQESNKIADYLLKQSNSDDKKSEAYYIRSFSHFIMGNLDQSLSDAYAAKNLGDKNSEIQQNSQQLINEILRILELNVKHFSFADPKRPTQLESISNHYHKGLDDISKNQLDKAEREAKALLSKSDVLDFRKALGYLILSEIQFEQKQHDSALIYGQKVQEFAQFSQNPFFEYESSLQLAKNYLALNQMEEYQIQSQILKETSIRIQKIETHAANVAHQLFVQDLEENQRKSEQKLKYWMGLILTMILIAMVVYAVFYIRYRSKKKTYTLLANYLKKQENQLLEQENVLELETEEEVEDSLEIEETSKPKPIQILKESEKQILQGLRKFEASQKYTNKDMSLSVLAGQLNTNTKYLSEIINRQKNKNFSSYINELRIKYITEKLRNDPNYLNYKVSYLAEECGFSSHSTFTTVFKSVVGVSPAIFIELIKEDNQNQLVKKLEHV